VVTERVVGDGSLPHVDGDYAEELGTARPPSTEPAREGSLLLSEVLIRELEESDALVISTPMHNFTVPSGLKAWLDHVVRIHRTFNATPEGKVGTLYARPVFVAVASGGRYSGEQARQPDFLTPYLAAILGTIGLRDPVFFSVEGMAFGADAATAIRTKTDLALQAHFFQGERSE
jgi:FMN-dependent NADH-azoreductase